MLCYVSFHYSEAEKQQLINEAQGAAEAVIAAGKARAQSIEMVCPKKLCFDTIGRAEGNDILYH